MKDEGKVVKVEKVKGRKHTPKICRIYLDSIILNSEYKMIYGLNG